MVLVHVWVQLFFVLHSFKSVKQANKKNESLNMNYINIDLFSSKLYFYRNEYDKVSSAIASFLWIENYFTSKFNYYTLTCTNEARARESFVAGTGVSTWSIVTRAVLLVTGVGSGWSTLIDVCNDTILPEFLMWLH